MHRLLIAVLMFLSLAGLSMPPAVSPAHAQAARAAQRVVHNPHCPDCITGLVLRACGMQIARAGNYRLAGDLGPCDGDGVDIRAAGVVFNLAGFTVRGSNTGRGAGIRIWPGVADTTITHGTVAGFGTGVDDSGAATVLTHLVLSADLGSGIFLHDAQHSVLLANAVRLAGRFGIYLQGALDARLLNNRITGSGIYGIWLQSTTGALVAGNQVTGAGLAGVFAGCGNTGISQIATCPASTKALIVANTINGSGADGLVLDRGSADDRVLQNRVTGSDSADLVDENACGANTWWGNVYGTALGSVVCAGS